MLTLNRLSVYGFAGAMIAVLLPASLDAAPITLDFTGRVSAVVGVAGVMADEVFAGWLTIDDGTDAPADASASTSFGLYDFDPGLYGASATINGLTFSTSPLATAQVIVFDSAGGFDPTRSDEWQLRYLTTGSSRVEMGLSFEYDPSVFSTDGYVLPDTFLSGGFPMTEVPLLHIGVGDGAFIGAQVSSLTVRPPVPSVPEPSSGLLVGLGVAALVSRARKRSR
jgi:hypothetical protein